MVNVSSIMSAEHYRINHILEKFEREFEEDPELAKQTFNVFKWNLEKHIFVEEKAIFDVYETIVGEEVSDVFDLMEEHGVLIDLVNSIEENLYEDNEFNLSELKEELNKHHVHEDSKFYPDLDNNLDEDQKIRLIERIKEIIRG
jgi:iron-sulfur cluster repair protein YtfE (RIC family)